MLSLIWRAALGPGRFVVGIGASRLAGSTRLRHARPVNGPPGSETEAMTAGGHSTLAARLADHVRLSGPTDCQGPAGAEHACCGVAIVVLVVLLAA